MFYLEDKLVKAFKNTDNRIDDKKEDNRHWRKRIYSIPIKYWYFRKIERKETDGNNQWVNQRRHFGEKKNNQPMSSNQNAPYISSKINSKTTQLKHMLAKFWNKKIKRRTSTCILKKNKLVI